ncbi:MAG: O-antigen ligase family protein, partial [Chloroflexi bacterium]|nr:O-antigen ligase family protein [Chloroflexota bacterium]
MIPFIPTQYAARMLTITDIIPDTSASYSEDASFRGRTSELMVGWLMFKDHPLLGVGYDNYPVYYQEYSRRVGLDPRLEQRSAHNIYIEVAAELGLFGLAAFGLIIWGVLNSIWRAYQSFKVAGMKEDANMAISFGVGVVGYLAAAMFIHDAYPRFLWLLVGISLSLMNVAKNETGRVG